MTLFMMDSDCDLMGDEISKLSKTTVTSSAAVCASVTTLSIAGQRGENHSKNNHLLSVHIPSVSRVHITPNAPSDARYNTIHSSFQ